MYFDDWCGGSTGDMLCWHSAVFDTYMVIMSDSEPSFASEVMQELAGIFGAKHWDFGPVSSPQHDKPAEYATPIPVLSAPASYPAGACGPENLATRRPRRCPSASLLQAALRHGRVSEIFLQLNYMATTISLSFLLRIMLIRL